MAGTLSVAKAATPSAGRGGAHLLAKRVLDADQAHEGQPLLELLGREAGSVRGRDIAARQRQRAQPGIRKLLRRVPKLLHITRLCRNFRCQILNEIDAFPEGGRDAPSAVET